MYTALSPPTPAQDWEALEGWEDRGEVGAVMWETGTLAEPRPGCSQRLMWSLRELTDRLFVSWEVCVPPLLNSQELLAQWMGEERRFSVLT